LTHIDPDKVSQYIREVALEKIAPRFQNLLKSEVSAKTGPTDLVTIADLEAEIELTCIFKDLIPGSYVLGEEAVSEEETEISLLGDEDGYVWVIDPVDGTLNFASGNEKFGTIVALAHGGEIVQGWILDIPGDRMAIAEKGSGVELSGSRVVYPRMDKPLKEARGFIAQKFLPKPMKEGLGDVFETQFGNIESCHCCAHDYLTILAGEAYYAMYSRIRPWDHQAGGLMMKEAGGVIKKWDGSAYEAKDLRGGILCASDQEVWNEIYGLLLEKFI
jgi:fructose-1,6-bisphosphatase/inositol monophosphatase family enzyme